MTSQFVPYTVAAIRRSSRRQLRFICSRPCFRFAFALARKRFWRRFEVDEHAVERLFLRLDTLTVAALRMIEGRNAVYVAPSEVAERLRQTDHASDIKGRVSLPLRSRITSYLLDFVACRCNRTTLRTTCVGPFVKQ